jgi:hypothetical protein
MLGVAPLVPLVPFEPLVPSSIVAIEEPSTYIVVAFPLFEAVTTGL